MAVCTYDNPQTWRRECWQDGKLLCSYSFEILPPFSTCKIPREYFFFGANIGDWKVGQLVGDKNAMQSKDKL